MEHPELATARAATGWPRILREELPVDSLSRIVVALLIPVLLWIPAWFAGRIFDSRGLDIGERFWMNLGGLATLVLILLNVLICCGSSTLARRMILGASWLFAAFWWLKPIDVHPLKAPFYLGSSFLVLAFPYIMARSQRMAADPEATGLTPTAW